MKRMERNTSCWIGILGDNIAYWFSLSGYGGLRIVCALGQSLLNRVTLCYIKAFFFQIQSEVEERHYTSFFRDMHVKSLQLECGIIIQHKYEMVYL